MKKLLVKSCVLLALVFALLCLLNRWYTSTNFWKYQKNEIVKFASVPDHLQLANLGSSHGLNSFDYSGLPYRAFNFALSSQRYVYDYAVLKQYLNHFDRGAVCVILVEYFEITRVKKDFSDQIMRYYRFLDRRTMPEYHLANYIQYAAFPVLSLGNNIFNGSLNNLDKDLIAEQIERRASTMTISELKEYCLKKHESWTTDSVNGFEAEAGEEGFAYNQALLDNIIDLCMAHNIRPVLVSTPVTSILNGIYAEKSPDFFDTFYRFSREVCAKYPAVPYFDYSHDTRFTVDFSLFVDGDHLNMDGATKFTRMMVDDLISAGLLPAAAE
jgi:hypothetical protein